MAKLRRIPLLASPRAIHEQIGAQIVRQIAHLSERNLPLAPGLDMFAQDASQGMLKRTASAMSNDLSAGKTLEEAMRPHLSVFPGFCIALAGAGEQTGNLADMLWVAEKILCLRIYTRQRICGALLYPVTVISSACAVLSFISVWIFPRFRAMLNEMGVSLPKATAYAFDAGLFMANNWLVILLIVLTALFGVGVVITRPRFRRIRHFIPIVGPLLRSTRLVLFSGAMEIMLTRRFPLAQSIRLTETILTDKGWERAVRAIGDRLDAGESLANAMKGTHLLPSAAAWLIKTGEATGKLAEAFGQVKDLYSAKLEHGFDMLMNLAEPVIILLLSCFVGFFCAAFMGGLVEVMNSLL